MSRFFCIFTLIVATINVCLTQNEDIKNVDSARTSKSRDVLWNVFNNCVNSQVESVATCLKLQVLNYFSYDVNRFATARSLTDRDVAKIDRLVVKRFQRYMKSHVFKIQLPELIFQRATLVFNPKKDLTDFDVEFPKHDNEAEDRSMSVARDLMQQKALLPLLLLLKLKLKMITPIMLTLVSIKATKAMLMSKLALFMVSLFMISQVLKKLGMNLPMLHPPMDASLPPSAYGPPLSSPSNGYGVPSPSPSYGPPAQPNNYAESNSQWEPNSSYSNNMYSKMWDAQQLAYNAYYKPSSSSSFSSTSTYSS